MRPFCRFFSCFASNIISQFKSIIFAGNFKTFVQGFSGNYNFIALDRNACNLAIISRSTGFEIFEGDNCITVFQTVSCSGSGSCSGVSDSPTEIILPIISFYEIRKFDSIT